MLKTLRSLIVKGLREIIVMLKSIEINCITLKLFTLALFRKIFINIVLTIN